MIPRLNIEFPLRRQWEYWFGEDIDAARLESGTLEPSALELRTSVYKEYLLNHARTGIVMALRAALPKGGRVGVVVYNCHTVANAVEKAGCKPVFLDVTEELTIKVASVPVDLDAIVVTNLFGIHNDIAAIRKRLPKAIIIVDNAHGYGLPAEGDFTVYSINQGKFPALGEGGILVTNERMKELENERISEMYASLPGYNFIAQLKLFAQMMIKAIAYSPCIYWLVMRMKKSANPDVHEVVAMKKMAKGVRRLYKAWFPKADEAIAEQKRNAEKIDGAFYGENAFMAILRTDDLEALKAAYAAKGVETETHFKNAIVWAKQFGYVDGSCPTAEELTKKLLMIPTYTKI